MESDKTAISQYIDLNKLAHFHVKSEVYTSDQCFNIKSENYTPFSVRDIIDNSYGYPPPRPSSSTSYSDCSSASSSPSCQIVPEYVESPENKSSEEVSTPEKDADDNSNIVRTRKNRSSFSTEQVLYMESRFRWQKYLNTSDRSEIAQILHLSETQVKTWWQNRRMKLKRKVQESKDRASKAQIWSSLEQTGYFGASVSPPHPTAPVPSMPTVPLSHAPPRMFSDIPPQSLHLRHPGYQLNPVYSSPMPGHYYHIPQGIAPQVIPQVPHFPR